MLLLLLLALSLMLGAKSIPFHDVTQALFSDCNRVDCVIVRDARLPRTGGSAGRDQFRSGGRADAEPDAQSAGRSRHSRYQRRCGLCGGAGHRPVWRRFPADWLGFAFTGALLASLLVALTGALGGGRVNPVRLTLAGVALGAVLEGLTSGLSLLNPDIYDHLRFWHSGSLDIRSFAILRTTFPAVVAGSLLALLLARSLNSLSMGGDMATALGTRVMRTQLVGLLAIALLSGAATAAVGPIAFVGLMTPHLSRWLLGNDHRWMLPGTLLITPCLLLAADILGRLLVPGELRVSIVTAILGAPMLIVLVRRKSGRGQL